MNRKDHRKGRRPAVEGLESRALLTTLAHAPTHLSPAAVHVLQDNSNLSNNSNGQYAYPGGQNGNLGNTAGNPYNGGLGNAGGNLGGNGQGGAYAGQYDLRNAQVRFRNPGNGHLYYRLQFDSGGYRFRQTYQLDVNRAHGHNNGQNGYYTGNNGAPFGMLDALNLSVAGLQQQLYGGAQSGAAYQNGGYNYGGNGNNGNGNGHSSRTDAYGGTFRHNGGNNYEYQQQYTTGGYHFNAKWNFQLHRVHGNNNNNNNYNYGLTPVTALDAVDLFLTSLQDRVYAGYQNTGGMTGGTGGTTANGGLTTIGNTGGTGTTSGGTTTGGSMTGGF